jgi:hypothetical protein
VTFAFAALTEALPSPLLSVDPVSRGASRTQAKGESERRARAALHRPIGKGAVDLARFGASVKSNPAQCERRGAHSRPPVAASARCYSRVMPA